MVPIWGRDRIRLQTIRAGFPGFCAALAGYVGATRSLLTVQRAISRSLAATATGSRSLMGARLMPRCGDGRSPTSRRRWSVG
jgi:hypothetical protein